MLKKGNCAGGDGAVNIKVDVEKEQLFLDVLK